MRWLLSILLLVSFAQQPVDDHRVHVRTSSDAKTAYVLTDKLTVLNTDSDFLQIQFSTVHKKNAGLQGITISAFFIATTDLYEPKNKREFSLILDGDRVDFGAMNYSRYVVAERDGKNEFYAGAPPTRLDLQLPGEIKVMGLSPMNKLVAGSLDKFILGVRERDSFERVRRSKQITVKIGPHQIPLTDDQVKVLQVFVQRAQHG